MSQDEKYVPITDKVKALKDRYSNALHAVQSGVKYDQDVDQFSHKQGS